MATPSNTSGKLQADNTAGPSVLPAGFTFTAGRQAVLQIVQYATGQEISAVSIGGTAAVRIAHAIGGNNDADCWWVSSIGGSPTNEVVVTYSGGTDNYVSGAVSEWPAGTFSGVVSGSDNQATGNSASPSVATGVSLPAGTVSFAQFVANIGRTNNGISTAAPTGWTGVFTEQDSDNHEGGRGAWKEESTTGTKTATFSWTSGDWAASIVALLLAGGSTSLPVPRRGARLAQHFR